MLFTKIQPQVFIVLEKKIFKFFTIYGHGSYLFQWRETFEQIVNIPSKQGTMWNLVKIVRGVSEKKTIKKSQLYTCI